jgi:hypothetical protein
VYNPRCSPPNPLRYVLIIFDNYVGIPCDELLCQIVPIVPIESGTTRQLPSKLAWGLTIHKSQGLTLKKETINIEKKKDMVSHLQQYLKLKV